MAYNTIHDHDPALVVAVKMHRSELAAQDQLLENLLVERDNLLAALRPFVRAGKALSEQQQYRPRGQCYGGTDNNRVICSMGHVDLMAKSFADAIQVVEEAERPASQQKAEE